MTKEYIIYADESIKRGKKFSNFFGGALIRSQHLEFVNTSLKESLIRAGLHNEIKWTKVTSNYLQKYITVLDTFFDLIAEDKIKIRIMFTDNRFVPQGLTAEHREQEYFILYYQFLKHAFGLRYANKTTSAIRCRLYLDDMPDTKENIAKFKGYIEGLTKHFRQRIIMDREQIAEVKSHNHVVLQCLDVVLGSIQFRLNERHKEKPKGKTHRGSKTIAKEKLYRHIQKRIRQLRPHFNIGITTGKDGSLENLWYHSYRHWKFVPEERKMVESTKDK